MTRESAVVAPEASGAGASRSPVWLFSRAVDLGVFLGSALAALALLAIGAWLGVLHEDTPAWAWVLCVLLVDVAHVHATAFSTYFDRAELARRPALYALAPLLGYAIAVALYSEGAIHFWRALAYLAVFHFVRQQYGWVRLYQRRIGQRRLGQTEGPGAWLDIAVIYLATLYPLLYWHAHLPRAFDWFIAGDFFRVLGGAAGRHLVTVCGAVYAAALFAYVARAALLYAKGDARALAKDLVVATTAACWYVGIVVYDSDYAFTVTNVLIHGVPYFAIVYFTARRRAAGGGRPFLTRVVRRGPWLLISIALLLAFVEEFLWDHALWREPAHRFLFGGGHGWLDAEWRFIVVPLLALPQITHYVLDGFIWRGREAEVSSRPVCTPTAESDPRPDIMSTSPALRRIIR